VDAELAAWRERGVEGHFTPPRPWVDVGELCLEVGHGAQPHAILEHVPDARSIWTALLGGAARQAFGAGGAARTTVWWEPFPTLTTAAPSTKLGTFLSSSLSGFYIAMGFCVIPALAAANVVKERECKAKLQQLLMGATPASYWLSRWMWDALQYLVAWVGACVVAAVGGDVFTSGSNYPTLALMMLSYGFSVFGIAYALSFLFDKQAVAQTWVQIGFFLGTLVR
jgi:hypothetical protein